jgi:hypothetical protein
VTAQRHQQFTIWCDQPSCGATYRSEWDVPRAAVRKLLGKRGWTHLPSEIRPLDQDFCPEHKPVTP